MIEQCFKIKCTVKTIDPQKVATAYRKFTYTGRRFFFFIFKNWSIINLQYPVSFRCTAQWLVIHTHTPLNILWKDWCWSWNSNTLATWCKELTHWKRPWYWERLKAGGEGGDGGWDGWMASLTQWTWVWVNSGSYWWTGRPGLLQFIGSQRVRHDSNWSELNWYNTHAYIFFSLSDLGKDFLNKMYKATSLNEILKIEDF